MSKKWDGLHEKFKTILEEGTGFTHPSVVIAMARAGLGDKDRSMFVVNYVMACIIWRARKKQDYYESRKTIAASLGYSPSTVKTAMRRCRSVWRDGYVWKMDAFWPRPVLTEAEKIAKAAKYGRKAKGAQLGTSGVGAGGGQLGGVKLTPLRNAKGVKMTPQEVSDCHPRSQKGAQSEHPMEEGEKEYSNRSLFLSPMTGAQRTKPPVGGGSGPTPGTGQGLVPDSKKARDLGLGTNKGATRGKGDRT